MRTWLFGKQDEIHIKAEAIFERSANGNEAGKLAYEKGCF